jgi:dihydroflavonol-4-reductase
MKVFLTGGTGFIGVPTIRNLIDSGHQCVCLVRSSSKTESLDRYGCEFVTGDVTEKASLEKGMEGCEAVINLANVYSLWEPDFSIYKRVNVDGTRNVMEVAMEVGAKKVIHVSSIVTWGRTSQTPFNENTPVGEQTSEYARTKYEGDKIAWELHRGNDLPLVMIYPAAVLGAGDTKSTGNHVRLMVNRKIPIRGLESATITFVHVEDVAKSIVLALEKEGNVGEGYIIGKEEWSIGNLNRLISDISGVPLPLISIPDYMVKINAFFLTALANITKQPPAWGLSSDFVRNALTGLIADGSKAERELGISYTPIREAIRACIETIKSESEEFVTATA